MEGADTEVLLGGRHLIEKEQPLILSEARLFNFRIYQI